MSAPRLLSVACALLVACGSPSASSTPPLYAARPASSADAEVAPAHRLPEDTRPLRYGLTLEIVPDRPTFRGEVSIELALDRPRETLYLHAKGLTASSVRLLQPNAEVVEGKLESVSDSGLAKVSLPQPVGPGQVRLEIVYEGKYDDALAGLYRVKSGGAHYAFTQFEAISARKAFPCFDEPRFKTPFDVTLRLQKDHIAIANTRELSNQELGSGLREVRFASTEKLPTYLVAMAVGPFDVVSAPDLPPTAERPRALPLRGVAVKGRGPDLAYALRETPKIISALERYFAIGYPYDKLDLIAVPDFGAGAMENAGAITFRDTLLLVPDSAPEGVRRAFASVQAHELAHQWFGNLVTMPWWDDIWLNEAFATWMATRVIEEVYPKHEAGLGEVGYAQYAMDVDSQASARQIRQPIESDHDIANAFDAITYSKGGAVLSMFERYLGADAFREGLRLYMKRHAFGSAGARDLTTALGEAAKKPDVSAAFFSFLEQPGVPLVSVELDCTAQPALVLSQRRYLPVGGKAVRDARWQVPVCVRLGAPAPAPAAPVTKGGKAKTEPAAESSRELCQLMSEPTMRVPLEGACPRWVMPNAGAAGYYRWSLAGDGLANLVAVRATLEPRERMSLIGNVDASMRAGELGADAALRALLDMLDDPRRRVLESALGALTGVSDRLLDEATRPLLRAQIARRVRPAYEKLGLFPKAGEAQEEGETKLLRAVLVRALAFSGRDPAMLEELAQLGEAKLGLREDKRLAQLPSEILEYALAAAVLVRGTPVIDRALERLYASQDGLERGDLLEAVASTRDSELTERVLGLSLDEKLRTNERYVPVFYQHSYPETRLRAYAWLKLNFDALRAKLGEHGGAALVSAPEQLCSEEDALDVERSFGPRAKDLMGGPRELALATESIRLCASLRAAQGEKARLYLRNLAAVESSARGRKPAAPASR